MTFDEVLASLQGANAVLAELERRRLKYNAKKVIADGNDVCVFCAVTLSGVKLLTCG